MPRIMIIHNLESELDSLGLYSEILGHDPVLKNINSCKVFQKDGKCERDYPCSDYFLIDKKLSEMSGINIIETQSENGCKIPVQHKSVIAGEMSQTEFRRVKQIGCYVLKKPVVFEMLEGWLNRVVETK